MTNTFFLLFQVEDGMVDGKGHAKRPHQKLFKRR